MNSRRSFIKKSSLGLTNLIFLPKISFSKQKTTRITILHTNDMHSHIEPFKSGKYKALGGMAKRATIIKKIRETNENVLLFDAGDIFQGTPYFNFYGGELEFKLMSEMRYDGATLGNHDFDNGLKGLKTQLKHAKFPFIVSNYNFSNTILRNQFQPYKIFKKGPIRIGVIGVGIELDGLVPKKLYEGTVYEDPITKANFYAKILKEKKKCDFIICLSHLGLKYKSQKISDLKLAKKTKNIDLIIGGHTHTFLEKPINELNLNNDNVIINQVGWGGINIGKIDLHFSQNNVKKLISGRSIFIKNHSNVI